MHKPKEFDIENLGPPPELDVPMMYVGLTRDEAILLSIALQDHDLSDTDMAKGLLDRIHNLVGASRSVEGDRG